MNQLKKQMASEVEVDVITPKQDEFMDDVFREFLEERKIIFNDYVDDKLVERAIMQIIRFNKEDLGKPSEMRTPIILHINTLGGDVSSGLSLIDAIQNSKTPVYGVCHKAYSMGLYIFISCHKRYVFKNTTLLLHEGSVGSHDSNMKFLDLAGYVSELNSRLKKLLLGKTNIGEEEYDRRKRDEWYIFGWTSGDIPSAKDLGITDHVIGEDAELDEIL